MSRIRNVGIVGAGLAGSVLGMFLKRRGHQVTILEKHGEPVADDPPLDRSINLTLTKRGLDALQAVGVANAVMDSAAPARYRIAHLQDGRAVEMKYDEQDNALHSIGRGRLNRLLLDHLRRDFDCRVEFGSRILSVSLESAELVVEAEGRRGTRKFDAIVGADGAFSTVRLEMQKKRGFDFMQEFSRHANIELRVPTGSGWNGRNDALHVWPREESMLIAFPNRDGSFTLTLQLPVDGPLSVAELIGRGAVSGFFADSFPKIAPFVSDIEAAVRKHPATQMISIKCGKWHAGGKVGLIGDAAHAVFPSYGQGANAAFEDCMIFDSLLEETGDDFPETFRRFYELRKSATDALCDLSREHYHSLRSSVGDDHDDLKLRLRSLLREACPSIGPSMYSNIAFTHIPYDAAYRTERAVERAVESLAAHGELFRGG